MVPPTRLPAVHINGCLRCSTLKRFHSRPPKRRQLLELKRRVDSTAVTLPITSALPCEELSRTQDKRIQKVQVVIQNDLRRSWTAQELAQLVNLSPSHLRRLFKDETGRSLCRHLKGIRMHLAMTLLTSQFLSVKEVMNRVGIANHSHFTKDFKSAHGISPSRINKSKLRA